MEGQEKGRQGQARKGQAREGKGMERKGREGKGMEGKGREGKGRKGKARQGHGQHESTTERANPKTSMESNSEVETQRNPNTPNASLIRVLLFVLTQPPAGSARCFKP